jgi:hypothetical protein
VVTVAVSPTIKLSATISAPVASIKPTASRGLFSSMALSPMNPIGQRRYVVARCADDPAVPV